MRKLGRKIKDKKDKEWWNEETDRQRHTKTQTETQEDINRHTQTQR